MRLARLLPLLLLVWAGCRTARPPAADGFNVIAFGSCANQTQPQPIWDAVLAERPDVFLFLGDNVYADTENMDTMRVAYEQLGAQPGFQRLRAETPVLATWDDHDFGVNDGGADYPQREFLRFFGIPDDDPRWSRPGVYSAHRFENAGRTVQIILLDTRYFRSPLTRAPAGKRGPYVPNTDRAATLLGDAQWQWLEERLQEPADLRVIASSIQVVPEDHGWEKWANLPHEHDAADDPANRPGYPIYDVTASALNRPSGAETVEVNRHRVHETNYRPVNFGTIRIDWSAADPLVEMRIHDIDGNVVLGHAVRLSELTKDE